MNNTNATLIAHSQPLGGVILRYRLDEHSERTESVLFGDRSRLLEHLKNCGLASIPELVVLGHGRFCATPELLAKLGFNQNGELVA